MSESSTPAELDFDSTPCGGMRAAKRHSVADSKDGGFKAYGTTRSFRFRGRRKTGGSGDYEISFSPASQLL